MKANAISEGLQFISLKDLVLNEKTVVRARWFAEEKTLKLEIFEPCLIAGGGEGFICRGNISFPGAAHWIQKIVDTGGECDVGMNIAGLPPEEAPAKRPLVIAENDQTELVYDETTKSVQIKCKGGSIDIPLAAIHQCVNTWALAEVRRRKAAA
jgi:hypothetical protein